MHGGAARRGARAVVAPDVEEYGRARTIDGASVARHIRVVMDEQLDAVGVVIETHPLLFLPCCASWVLETYVAVVELGVGSIAYPDVCGTDSYVLHAACAGDGLCMRRVEATEGEDACGRAPVSLDFCTRCAWVDVETMPPDEPRLAESPRVGPEDAYPLTLGIALEKGELDMGGIPPIGDANDGLLVV